MTHRPSFAALVTGARHESRLALGNPEIVHESVTEAESSDADAGRRHGPRLPWAPALVLAWLIAALVFALLFRMPDARVLGQADALSVAAAQLGWSASLADADGAARAATAHRTLLRRHEQLRDALQRDGFESPALAAFERRLAMADAQPTPAALASLGEAAETLAGEVSAEYTDRADRVEHWLKALSVLLVLSLALPVAGLWRERQRVRRSLRQFSSRLGRGDWHDAVRGLRDEQRSGAPSTFGDLASGVEDVLGQSERRWRALADLSIDWYWETDEGHRLSWISGPAPPVQALGLSTSSMLGRRRDQLGHLDAPAGGWEAFHARCDRHEPFRDVEFGVRAPGQDRSRWVSLSGRPRFDARGEFAGYEGVGRDVTERRAAHDRLLASEQRWSMMTRLASDWYWETDTEHRLLPLPAELARRYPAMAEQVEGRTRWDVHRDALGAEQWAEHRADLDARRPFRGLQFEMATADGRFVWVSISGIPRTDADGRFVGYHGVGRDITVRKQAERLLLRHNEALQRAVEERTRELEQINLDLDAFSRQLAHELRTPIGHIEGLAGLIETRGRERLSDDDRELLRLQARAAQSMRQTIDALMLLARSTVQAMPMSPVDVSALARQAIEALPPIERRAAVDWRVQPAMHATASPAALQIVLANLLGNAAKFTRRSEAPQVEVRATTDADGRVRIAVADNGAGFDPALADTLFVPFKRLHSGDDFHGTGVGLSIVQRIVERHGGSVAARGAPGQGAVFEFTLPPVPPA